MGADDRQFWKVFVEALHIGEPPHFNVENNGFGTIPGNVIKQLLVGVSDMHQEVSAQSAGQGPSNDWVFFEYNHTLSHRTPILQPSSTATKAVGWLGHHNSTDN